MDFVKNLTGGGNNEAQGEGQQRQDGGQQNEQKSEGGFLGGITDKFNSAAGGGKESEKNEDMLDKGRCPFLFTFESGPSLHSNALLLVSLTDVYF